MDVRVGWISESFLLRFKWEFWIFLFRWKCPRPCCSLVKLTFLSVSLLIVAVKSTRMSISRRSPMGLTRSVAQGQLLCGLCNYWPGPPISVFTSVVCVWTLQLEDRGCNGILISVCRMWIWYLVRARATLTFWLPSPWKLWCFVL